MIAVEAPMERSGCIAESLTPGDRSTLEVMQAKGVD
jgi:hypothetical protein